MKLTEAFNYGDLIKFATMHRWMSNNGYKLDDALAEIARINKEKVKEANRWIDEDDKELLKSRPELLKVFDFCDKCKRILTAFESRDEKWELDLVCREHGMIKQLDISPMDYNMAISAEAQGKEPDFDPEEIRASVVARETRRAFCKDCEFRTNIRCRKCGCSVKHRTYYEILHCPIGKW